MNIEVGDKLTVLLAGSLIIFLKITVLIVAYKIIKLGYDLLLKGVKGDFHFKGEMTGHKADLRSSSPSLLFVLLGCFVIIISVTTQFPQDLETEKRAFETSSSLKEKAAFLEIPEPDDDDFNLEALLEEGK